jgi:hypothetical protein
MLIGGCSKCGRTFPLVEVSTCYQCYKENNISHKRDLKINKILKSKKIFWQFWKK